jgi:hypothetical protein
MYEDLKKMLGDTPSIHTDKVEKLKIAESLLKLHDIGISYLDKSSNIFLGSKKEEMVEKAALLGQSKGILEAMEFIFKLLE